MFVLKYVCPDCSSIYFEGIPEKIVMTISTAIYGIKIGIIVLVIIFGMLDLGKAVIAQKEEEIKKGQQSFLKRLLTAAIVFFVVVLAEFVVKIAAGEDESTSILNCADCIITYKNN